MKSQTPQTIKPLSLTLLLTLSLSGCSWLAPYHAPITQGTVMPSSVLQELQPGLTRDQVRALLGPEMGGTDPFDPKHSEYVFYTTDKNLKKQVAHHLILDYDNDGYLASWKEAKPVSIKHRAFLWWK